MEREPEKWLDILADTYKVSATRDGDLVSLKYDQLESPMHEPIVQQCRGMVVHTAVRRVLAWPYNKFFNHGEAGAADIDWSSARVQEKLDGSLMILYAEGTDDGLMWRVASSGTPRAGGSYGSDSRTFSEAFWETWFGLGLDIEAANFEATYMFELCDSPNRVVVRHNKPRLVLHGGRWLESGVELTRDELVEAAYGMGCELVKEFPIHGIADVIAAADALDPIQQEGFVVVDDRGHRVKVKSPRYVILHHLKGEATPRRAIELWQTGETGELLAHFPEFLTVIGPVQERLDAIAVQSVRDFHEEFPRPSRKEFALAVKDRPHATVLFRLIDHGSEASLDHAKAIMRRQTPASLERMLGL